MQLTQIVGEGAARDDNRLALFDRLLETVEIERHPARGVLELGTLRHRNRTDGTRELVTGGVQLLDGARTFPRACRGFHLLRVRADLPRPPCPLCRPPAPAP